MSISLISTWLTGAINGYMIKEEGIPTNIKYSVLGLTVIIHIIKGIKGMPLNTIKAGPVSVFFGIPLAIGAIEAIGAIGANYYLGNCIGELIYYVEDKRLSKVKQELI